MEVAVGCWGGKGTAVVVVGVEWWAAAFLWITSLIYQGRNLRGCCSLISPVWPSHLKEGSPFQFLLKKPKAKYPPPPTHTQTHTHTHTHTHTLTLTMSTQHTFTFTVQQHKKLPNHYLLHSNLLKVAYFLKPLVSPWSIQNCHCAVKRSHVVAYLSSAITVCVCVCAVSSVCDSQGAAGTV